MKKINKYIILLFISLFCLSCYAEKSNKEKKALIKEFTNIVEQVQKQQEGCKVGDLYSAGYYIKQAKYGKFNLKKGCYYLRPARATYKVGQILTDQVLYFDYNSRSNLPPIILDKKLKDRVYIEGQEFEYGAEFFQYVGITNYTTALGIQQQAFVFHPIANKRLKEIIDSGAIDHE